jgi:hypothetical protein
MEEEWEDEEEQVKIEQTVDTAGWCKLTDSKPGSTAPMAAALQSAIIHSLQRLL